MKKGLLLLICALLLMALCPPTTAGAGKKQGKDRQGASPPLHLPTRSEAETEPNNDCVQTDGPIVAGGAFDCEITTGDRDVFEFSASSVGEHMMFRTIPREGLEEMDTVLRVLFDDCATVLAENDDGGTGVYSLVLATFPAPGTFYIEIVGYEGDTGFYSLIAATFDPLPNDICENAIDLYQQHLQEFGFNSCGAHNDYDPGYGGCAYWEQWGPDVAYSIYLDSGQLLSVTWTGDYDGSLYLVTDCDNLGTCVAAADDGMEGEPETLEYIATSPGVLFLIVDTYDGCGPAHVTINNPTSQHRESWGAVKARYR